MAIYQYQALSDRGKKVGGIINADSLADAKDKLRTLQMMVVDVTQMEEVHKRVKLPIAVVVDFTRMVGQLLKAGIPLYESLVIIEERYRRHRFHSLFVDFCDSLKSGRPLSETLTKYPHSFDPIYVAMVKAGEETASLAHIFDELCHLLERQRKLKKELYAAAAYPLFLGSFCFIVFITLLLFVIPSLKTLFEGRSLHPITQTVFALSEMILSYGPWLALGIFGLVLLGVVTLRIPKYRRSIDRIWLRLPVIGNFCKEAAAIRFCRTASLLLSGGIPILKTLALSRSVVKNRLLEEIFEKAQRHVSEGKTLSSQLFEPTLIPPIVPRMLAIAEETGKTSLMLQSIADITEENLERDLHQFIAFLQPALLLLLGLIVGVVLLSILIPLTDVGGLT